MLDLTTSLAVSKSANLLADVINAIFQLLPLNETVAAASRHSHLCALPPKSLHLLWMWSSLVIWWSVLRHKLSSTSQITSHSASTLTSLHEKEAVAQRLSPLLTFTKSCLENKSATSDCLFAGCCEHSTEPPPWSWLENVALYAWPQSATGYWTPSQHSPDRLNWHSYLLHSSVDDRSPPQGWVFTPFCSSFTPRHKENSWSSPGRSKS